MKSFRIALFLSNIFAISMALVPKNVEIVMKQYVDPSTREIQDGVYEKRSNYLKEGDKYPDPKLEEQLFDLKSLKGIASDLQEAADKIVAKNPDNKEGQSGGLKLVAHEPEFTVTFNDLTVEDLSNLLQRHSYPRRISGEVQIGPNTDSTGRAAAAAAKPPSD